jgi:hypothetical protein
VGREYCYRWNWGLKYSYAYFYWGNGRLGYLLGG